MGKHVQRTCPVCEVVYTADATRLKHGRQTTCGRACSYRLRGQQKETGVQLSCATCGMQFSRAPTHVKGKHGSDFCSRECHYAGRRLGLTKRVVTKPYRYSQESLAALSKAAARTYASGQSFPYPETELAAAELLARHGIAAVHQHLVDLGNRAIVVDFFFPGRNLVIEVDSPAQHNGRRHLDAERDNALAAAGLSVRRIPDDGVLEHVARAVLLAVVG